MPAVHAPPGGVTIRGKEYRGGMFIPAEVVDSLSDEEAEEAGLKQKGSLTPHPKHTARKSVYEQNAEDHFGRFSADEWNHFAAEVVGELPKDANDKLDTIESWPEFQTARAAGRSTSESHQQALHERVWKRYLKNNMERAVELDRHNAFGKPGEKPGDILPALRAANVGRGPRWGEKQAADQFVTHRQGLYADLEAEYGPAGFHALNDAANEVWNRPLTPDERNEVDRQAKEVDDNIAAKGWNWGDPRPGHRAAEQRVRLDAAAALAREKLGPVEDPELVKNLKELATAHNLHTSDVRDLYDEFAEQTRPEDQDDDEADAWRPDHADIRAKVDAELSKRAKVIGDATAEFEAAYGDEFDEDKLNEYLSEAETDGEENPAEFAVERYRKELESPHDDFFEEYHNQEDAHDRAQQFMKAVDAGEIKFGRLTEDEKDIIADDLANQFEAADTVINHALTRVGEMEPGEADLYARAMSKMPDGVPTRGFMPGKRGYGYIDLDELNLEDRELAEQMVRVHGAVWRSPDGSKAIIEHKDTGAEMYDSSLFEDARSDLDDPEDAGKGWQGVFDSLPDEVGSVGEHDVPAAARNFGRVSAGENATLPDDWNPNDVDVYKPVSKDHFILRRGDANPAMVNDGEPRYELVKRKNTGQRVGLPPQFWEGMESRDHDASYSGETNDEGAETNAKRDTRRSKKEQKARPELKRSKSELEGFHKQFGSLADRHNRQIQRETSAAAHDEKATTAKDSFENGYKWFSRDGGDLSDAGDELEEAVNDLNDISYGHPVAPEFSRADIRGMLGEAKQEGQEEDTKTRAKAFTEKVKEAKDEHKDVSDTLDEHDADFDEHFTKLKAGWERVLTAATAARKLNLRHAAAKQDAKPVGDEEDESETITAADARESAATAFKLERLAQRQLKKLGRSKTQTK